MTKLKLEELILLLQAERVRRKIPFETIAKRGVMVKAPLGGKKTRRNPTDRNRLHVDGSANSP